ncbi:MAG: GntR family transcriptional regulator [Clostridia bacterium]|nr:GntR family transcriptional regulator [Clostridia bacterium]
MFRIDPLSRQPVYEQLIDQLERLVLTGLLPPETQLPSVRSLSLELKVNPNTIQKAYSELDTRGIIYSVPGIGCFVSPQAVALLQAHTRNKLAALRALAAELALGGLGKDELIACIDEIYQERRSSD